MTRNEAVFTYSGDEPTVDHAGDLVVDKALDVLDKMLDVQLKQLDIIHGSLTTRIFLREGSCIKRIDDPHSPRESFVTPSKLAALRTAINNKQRCYTCNCPLDGASVADWYGYRHAGCPEEPKQYDADTCPICKDLMLSHHRIYQHQDGSRVHDNCRPK